MTLARKRAYDGEPGKGLRDRSANPDTGTGLAEDIRRARAETGRQWRPVRICTIAGGQCRD